MPRTTPEGPSGMSTSMSSSVETGERFMRTISGRIATKLGRNDSHGDVLPSLGSKSISLGKNRTSSMTWTNVQKQQSAQALEDAKRKGSSQARYDAHSYMSMKDTSAFIRAATYDMEFEQNDQAVPVTGQLTSKMLLASKQNVHQGVKLLSVSEINARYEFFKCRLKVLKNFKIQEDGANEDCSSVLKAAKASSASFDETPLSLTKKQIQVLKNSNMIPELKIKNVEHDVSDEAVTIFYSKKSTSYFGLHNYEVNLTVYSIIELRDYPFDCQDLMIDFSVEGAAKNKYTICCHQLDIKCSQYGVNIAEDWEVCLPRCVIKNTAQTELHLRVTRVWFHVVVNIVVITCILAALSLLTFANPPDMVGDRLMFVVTLALTIVANKNSTAGDLPHMPYATCLDNFFWYALLFLCAVANVSAWPALSCYWLMLQHARKGDHETKGVGGVYELCMDDHVSSYTYDVRNFQILAFCGSMFLCIWVALAWRVRHRVRRKAGPPIIGTRKWECFSFMDLRNGTSEHIRSKNTFQALRFISKLKRRQKLHASTDADQGAHGKILPRGIHVKRLSRGMTVNPKKRLSRDGRSKSKGDNNIAKEGNDARIAPGLEPIAS